MTREEKELLVKDICQKLPYGVKIRVEYPFLEEKDWRPEDLYGLDLRREVIAGTSVRIEEFKPYLRPMSSMTEEESEKFEEYLELQSEYTTGADIRFKYDMFDWLNSRHFDYRHLIEKGLAIEAPEGMYNF